ncbi:hypothetical protein GGI11_005341 [Coemansia sp. RSA 2049]|nr:hypothetical protein GGI11_005341 [Coemansia sp. RSA 2049]KAJ2514206.1 hypothetical protein H4217_005892 [Coemansia sp. RSA 1939]KAJ2597111.1 hypothetical protein EV177_007801 [Coemansia sp. RSA 1804]KAJ2682702.1 hypothetical protein GGH99_004635 [Coemansia sp. RSA 1285]
MSGNVSASALADTLRSHMGLRAAPALQPWFVGVRPAIVPLGSWSRTSARERKRFLLPFLELENYEYRARPLVTSAYRLSAAVNARDREYRDTYERETDVIRVAHSFMATTPLHEDRWIEASAVVALLETVFQLLYDNCAHINALRSRPLCLRQ